MSITVDTDQLETKVKDTYRNLAEEPHGQFHFELGEQMALHAGEPRARDYRVFDHTFRAIRP